MGHFEISMPEACQKDNPSLRFMCIHFSKLALFQEKKKKMVRTDFIYFTEAGRLNIFNISMKNIESLFQPKHSEAVLLERWFQVLPNWLVKMSAVILSKVSVWILTTGCGSGTFCKIFVLTLNTVLHMDLDKYSHTEFYCRKLSVCF